MMIHKAKDGDVMVIGDAKVFIRQTRHGLSIAVEAPRAIPIRFERPPKTVKAPEER